MIGYRQRKLQEVRACQEEARARAVVSRSETHLGRRIDLQEDAAKDYSLARKLYRGTRPMRRD